jgi:biotin transport system substrate-specific component
MQMAIALQLTRRARQQRAFLVDSLLVVGGSLLVVAMSQLVIPLPWTPVPITGQTFAVLIVGATLGSRLGSYSLALYLMEGIAGLPVFAGGSGGIGHLLGPTGGYMVGFVLAAGVVGWLAERGWDRRPGKALLAFLLGELAIYLPGVLWLAFYVGSNRALMAGFWPYLPGDAIKVVLAAVALPSAWGLTRQVRDVL